MLSAVERPWLSVLMPVYRGERFLRIALESIRREEDPGIEVIAVDDGSTDASLSILESYSNQLPLRVVTLPHTGNWVANTNRALAEASADYASILHQDDYWLRGRSARMKAELSRRPGMAMVFHAVWFVDAAGHRLGRWSCPLPSRQAIGAEELAAKLLIQNFISIVSPVFRVNLARSAGGLDEGLWYAADWDFWLRMIGSGPSIYVDDTLAGFRVHRGSQTIERGRRSSDLGRQLETVLDRQIAKSGDTMGKAFVRAARFSVEVNVVLSSSLIGALRQLPRLAGRAVRLGPRDWRRYASSSRLGERLRARIRTFSFSPWWLYFVPGALLILAGGLGGARLAAGPVPLSRLTFDTNTLLLCGMASIVGVQLWSFGAFAQLFAEKAGLSPITAFGAWLRRWITASRGLAAGAGIAFLGLVLLLRAIALWRRSGFAAMSYPESLRLVIPSMTFIAVGVQTFFATLLIDILAYRNQ